jgi:hypothetical protein
MVWEDFTDRTRPAALSRTRVPWGWLVLATEEVTHIRDGILQGGWDWRTSITFVFDPFHNWKVT